MSWRSRRSWRRESTLSTPQTSARAADSSTRVPVPRVSATRALKRGACPGGGLLRWGFTALHKAAQRGQHWVVKVLLERPEAVRLSKAVVRLGGSTPLLLAVEKGLLPESPPALPALCRARNRRARARGGRAPRWAPAMHQVPSRGVPRPRVAPSPRSLLRPDRCSRPSALRSAVPPTRAALRADAGVPSRLGRRR